MTEAYQPTVEEAAWLYAKAGWLVLPLHDVTARYCSCADGPLCRVPAKHPRLRAGYASATTDTRKIEQWWTRWPHANIGIATGGPHGLITVDLDGEAGRASWQQLTVKHGRGPEPATTLTPHGSHLWYRTPEGLSVPRRIGSVAAHVDILGDGGYAVAPHQSSAASTQADTRANARAAISGQPVERGSPSCPHGSPSWPTVASTLEQTQGQTATPTDRSA